MRRTRPCPPINPDTLVIGIDIANAMHVAVALEPTGHYAETLVRWLATRAVPTFSVQPLHTHRAKVLLDGSSRKTDAKDAEVVAMLFRQGFARPYRVPIGPFAVLRVASHQ